jgi:hypothetical protein
MDEMGDPNDLVLAHQGNGTPRQESIENKLMLTFRRG